MSKIKNFIKESVIAIRCNIIAKFTEKRGDFYISDAVISEHSVHDTKCTRYS